MNVRLYSAQVPFCSVEFSFPEKFLSELRIATICILHYFGIKGFVTKGKHGFRLDVLRLTAIYLSQI